MSNRALGWVIAAVFAFVAVCWAASLFLVPAAFEWMVSNASCGEESASECGAKAIASYGAFGDMFGAASALFSGLALAAIALTLYIDAAARVRSRRPLVVAQLDTEYAFQISRPVTADGSTTIVLEGRFSIANKSDEPAFNASVQISVPSIGLKVSKPHSGFVIEQSSVEWKAEVTAESVESALRLLTENRTIELHVAASYSNLDGAKWRTSHRYAIARRGATRDVDLLNSIRNGEWVDRWDAQDVVQLTAKVVADSWTHASI